MFSRQWFAAVLAFEMNGFAMLSGDDGKCLGYWWKVSYQFQSSMRGIYGRLDTPFTSIVMGVPV